MRTSWSRIMERLPQPWPCLNRSIPLNPVPALELEPTVHSSRWDFACNLLEHRIERDVPQLQLVNDLASDGWPPFESFLFRFKDQLANSCIAAAQPPTNCGPSTQSVFRKSNQRQLSLPSALSIFQERGTPWEGNPILRLTITSHRPRSLRRVL